MPYDTVLTRLTEAALEGHVTLAALLLNMALNPPAEFMADGVAPVAALGQFFTNDPCLDRIRPTLAEAAAYGALTWSPEASHDSAHAIGFLLRAFNSPEVAVAIARRMNGLKPVSAIFTPTSAVAGHLIETAALQAGSPSVRARLLDLFRNVRFSKFYWIIFLNIVRLDAKSIPMFIDRMLLHAPSYPIWGGRPSYMIGFDRLLNGLDVENILMCLSELQTEEFARLFLVHSRVFLATDAGIVEQRDGQGATLPVGAASAPAVDAEEVIFEAEETPAPSTGRPPGHAASIWLGQYAHHLDNLRTIYDDLASVGVREQSMYRAWAGERLDA